MKIEFLTETETMVNIHFTGKFAKIKNVKETVFDTDPKKIYFTMSRLRAGPHNGGFCLLTVFGNQSPRFHIEMNPIDHTGIAFFDYMHMASKYYKNGKVLVINGYIGGYFCRKM